MRDRAAFSRDLSLSLSLKSRRRVSEEIRDENSPTDHETRFYKERELITFLHLRRVRVYGALN